MKRLAILATVFSTVLVVVLPFVGGGGPGLTSPAVAVSGAAAPPLSSIATAPVAETETVGYTQRIDEAALAAQAAATAEALSKDWEHLAQKVVPKPVVITNSSTPAERRAAREATGQGGCPGMPGGGAGGSGGSSAMGVQGTTSDDIASFAYQFNAIRVANCLDPIPYNRFYVDMCMQARLFWMAESPSPDPMDAWGHAGSVRADGVPDPGCDGNLAGGSGNSGATVAEKWWASGSHRASLYRPTSGVGGACIAFAMTHGGIDEPYSFTRAAAKWVGC
ncbi:MAG TPA: hypothetical protein VN200_11075 [Rhodoglobus sp.]|nr:hypothetical protein [Rhodoglobus sp.]